MKKFYGGTYISKKQLEENNIYHPIRLEYYKIESEVKNKLCYGIEVVKTEYKDIIPEVQKNEVKNITMKEEEIIELLEKFKEGTVMPGALEEIVEERVKNREKLC